MRSAAWLVPLLAVWMVGCFPPVVEPPPAASGPRPTRVVTVDEPKLTGCTSVPQHLRVYYPCKGGTFGYPPQPGMWTHDTWTKDKPAVPR